MSGEQAHVGDRNPDADAVETIDLGELDLEREPVFVERLRSVEDTRAKLAFALVALLAGIVLSLVLLLAWKRITADDFQKLAGVLISPVVALVGAATGYYYGRGSRK